MKLYGVPLSVHTRKVQLALRAKKLDHELQVVIPIMPETRPENWDDLSPTGLIPVLQDDAYTLPDSGAIMQYLDARYPRTPLVPADPMERGRAIWIESYLGGFFRDVLHPVFHQRVVAPMQGRSTDFARVDQVLSDVAPRYLDYLDRISGKEWLAGQTLSVADIATCANLILYHYLGETLSGPRYPSLAAYFRRLLTLPIVAEQLAAEKPFAEQMGFSQESIAY